MIQRLEDPGRRDAGHAHGRGRRHDLARNGGQDLPGSLPRGPARDDAFDDIADLNAYIGLPADTANDNASAALVLARAGAIDGYMVEEDAVHDDPEDILFAGGLATLRLKDQLEFQ